MRTKEQLDKMSAEDLVTEEGKAWEYYCRVRDIRKYKQIMEKN